MKLGPLELGSHPLFLAPMEDVSDPPFRLLCRRMGADVVVTEFISSGGLTHGAEDSVMKLDLLDEERPVGVQIFGGDPEQIREAASIVEEARPDFLDINFGCPVKKVVNQQAGAAVLRDLEHMRKLAEIVVRTVKLPVTVKTRLGWNEQEIRILEVVRMLQDVGVVAVAVHARTRAQLYRGRADWSWLRRLKEDPGIAIPIIGNGDALSPEAAVAMFRETGVDAVMVGRGAVGNPWFFREAKALLAGCPKPAPPSLEERVAVVREHLQRKCEWLGERRGILEMRRMYSGYFRGIPGGARMRRALMEAETLAGVLAVLDAWESFLRAKDGVRREELEVGSPATNAEAGVSP